MDIYNDILYPLKTFVKQNISFFDIFLKKIYILNGGSMEILKKIRKNMNLTQDEVAEMLGIPKPTYSHYETGRNEPSLSILKKIADILNCSTDYLLGHQTKNMLYLDSYTPTQKRIIEAVKDLSEDESYQLLGYIARMKDVPLEVVLLKKRADEEE